MIRHIGTRPTSQNHTVTHGGVVTPAKHGRLVMRQESHLRKANSPGSLSNRLKSAAVIPAVAQDH